MYRDSIWKSIDWVTIVIYLMLIVFGWFSVCGASYDYSDRDFLDFSTRRRQTVCVDYLFVWFGFCTVDARRSALRPVLLSYLCGIDIAAHCNHLYCARYQRLPFLAHTGPGESAMAEFAKFATALALAKYMNSYSFSIKKWKCVFMLAFLILLPMLLIIMQRETGSALVYFAFFLMLYREGMPGVVLFSGLCAVVYFVVGIRFGQDLMADGTTPLGEYVVLLLVLAAAVGMTWVYIKRWE